MPLYTLHRDPAHFSPYPDEFHPDRWLSKSEPSSDTKSEWHTDTAAYMPFSSGPANCVGRGLALVELRMVIAVLMQRFDVKFEEGYDVGSYQEKLADRFITQVPELRVSLSLRH